VKRTWFQQLKKSSQAASGDMSSAGGKNLSSQDAPGDEFHADKAAGYDYSWAMSFTEVLQELPGLTLEQRQLLVRRALELDDPELSKADETLVENRLSALRDAPGSALSLDEMKGRLRSRHSK
jgi:uncharacterized protein Smg (DUF494 family)